MQSLRDLVLPHQGQRVLDTLNFLLATVRLRPCPGLLGTFLLSFVLLFTYILRTLEVVSGVFRHHAHIPPVFYDPHSALSSALLFAFYPFCIGPVWVQLMRCT